MGSVAGGGEAKNSGPVLHGSQVEIHRQAQEHWLGRSGIGGGLTVVGTGMPPEHTSHLSLHHA
eukprot:1139050-Pelagomonas_calceolata.AAC.4